MTDQFNDRTGGFVSNDDEQHLRILSVFHYVVGGLAALFACFPILHLVIGIVALTGGLDGPDEDFPNLIFGLIFTIIPLLIMAMGWTFSICMITAGRNLAQKKRRKFCLVMACIGCAFMPFGTVLGVFTIIVLMRPSVQQLFKANASIGEWPPYPFGAQKTLDLRSHCV